MNRKQFLQVLAGVPGLLSVHGFQGVSRDELSDFSKRLKPVGRILEMEGYYVWGCSPVLDVDGRVHVFYSRWKDDPGMGGWITSSEIAHAVAESPESDFEHMGTVFAPKGEGFWDGTTCHNPHIKKVDGKYCLFYIGNSNRKMDTQRIGLATADSPWGPWKRPDRPLLEPGEEGAWDSLCTTNPTFIKHPDGKYWLYYKSLNTNDYFNYTDPHIRGNRKYGLAMSDQLEGPYVKYENNPIIDLSDKGNNTQIEDGVVWLENGKFKIIARDMGIFSHKTGLYLESKDGKHWSEPQIGYLEADHYIKQPPAPPHLSKYGRFERPQLLIDDGTPTYLFSATQGGKFETASGFVFKVEPE